MPKHPRKISYIKKPFARKSLVSFPFALAALLCCGVSLGISIHLQGNGDLNVAAWAVSSMICSLIALFYGGCSFLEKEMNYILARISIGIGAVLMVLWVCMLIVGLFG